MAIKCSYVRPLISEYVDGVLANDKAWRVQLHVSVCPDCAEIAKNLAQTVGMLRSVRPAQMSSGFDAALASRLAAARAEKESALQRSWLSSILFSLRARLAVDEPEIRHGVRLSAPLIVAASVLAFMVAFSPTSRGTHPVAVVAPDTSQAFVKECVHDHDSYMIGQPFSDPSAQALMERQNDDSLAREGAVLLGSGNI